jgi:hypothetical protein
MTLLSLKVMPDRLAVCRLPPDREMPAWAAAAEGFRSLTRTADELSLVCAADAVPPAIQCDSGWRLFEVAGPLDFALTGILLSIARPLAEAGVSIFALSTYDTDYVLVKDPDLAKAVAALEAAGHHVIR